MLRSEKSCDFCPSKHLFGAVKELDAEAKTDLQDLFDVPLPACSLRLTQPTHKAQCRILVSLLRPPSLLSSLSEEEEELFANNEPQLEKKR